MRLDLVPDCHRAGRPRLLHWLGRQILAAGGWRVTGCISGKPHLVLVGGPHTSNWDFVVGIALLLALDLRVHWIGKQSIFRKPFIGLLTWLGGIPVNRSRPEGFVEDIAGQMLAAEAMVIAIAPEGTRSKVAKLKTGFARIARAAGCEVQTITLDFGERCINFGECFSPSADLDGEASQVRAVFARVQPKRPENF